jgi:hypothetical protein
MKNVDRLLRSRALPCSVVALVALVLRVVSASGPYYVDAFRHVYAIESGKLVIHAPGYFLFNAIGFVLSHLLHASAGSALQILNIAFSVAGAAVFYLLVSRIAAIPSPFLLALAYVCSPIVWFAGDIHSTYAAMTLFAPLLILVVECEQSFIWGCVLWAVMTGFRPSDGVFVLPWMVFQALRFPWKKRLIGMAAAIPLVAAWWIPTAKLSRSDMASPLRFSGMQVHRLAQGVLSGHVGIHALVNVFHAAAGVTMTWGLLTPFVCLGAAAFARNAVVRSMTVFLAPGVAFLFLYFISDGLYFAYAAAAGMVLAGVYLARWSRRQRQAGYAVAICASLLFMGCARPADGKSSRIRAVADAYFMKYSVPSLKEKKDLRLASLLDACGDSSVQGGCTD